MKRFLQTASTFSMGVWFGYVLIENLAPCVGC